MPKSSCPGVVDCNREFYDRIPDDEPIFILAARDLTSIGHIRNWIEQNRAAGCNPAKLANAERHLADFEQFQSEHPERCKFPD